MNKEQIMAKLKKGSMLTAVICAVSSLADLVSATYIFRCGFSEMQPGTRYQVAEICTALLFIAAIVAAAALLFYRIAKNGIPFTQQNARTVCIIGILFLLRSILPPAAGWLASDTETFRYSVRLLNYGNCIRPIFEGLLCLLIAYIMHYGAMLQQESDETL